MRVGITGSAGLIGAALRVALERDGHAVRGLDLRHPRGTDDHGDVRDDAAVARFVADRDAVVHLAAVSRVVWGDRDPELCRATNVDGTRLVLDAALREPRPPFVLYASSREVYGEPETLPVAEEAPLAPINTYGRSKVDAEDAVRAARADGLRAVVLRFSNVYGSTDDHADRVVPAFARAAATGGTLRVEGPDRTFDFCHLDDCVDGVLRAIGFLAEGRAPSGPVHLVTGRGTSLGELARLAVAAGGTDASIRTAPGRPRDVTRFVGDPARAAELLGWRARRPIDRGVADLVAAFRG